MPPPIWKKPIELLLARLRVPLGQFHHVFDAGLDRVDLLHVAVMTWPAYMLPSVASSQPGTNIGRFFSAAASSHEFFGSIWYSFFSTPESENFVHELVREKALARLVGADPFGQHGGLDPAHRFHLGDAGIGDAIHVALEQRFLVGGREVAVVGHALVVIVRDEIEDVLLEVRAGAADGGDLVLPDHFRERETELGGAHRAGQGHEHLAAAGEVGLVALGRINERGGIEMTVVMRDEIADGRAHSGRA